MASRKSNRSLPIRYSSIEDVDEYLIEYFPLQRFLNCGKILRIWKIAIEAEGFILEAVFWLGGIDIINPHSNGEACERCGGGIGYTRHGRHRTDAVLCDRSFDL